MNSNKYSKKTTGATTPTGKSSKGSVSIESVKGRLRLRFRVGGTPYTVSLGVSESEENWKLAQAKAKEVESDITFQKFDPTDLAKYRIVGLKVISNSSNLKLRELWGRYLEYKKSTLKPSTFDYLESGLGKFIDKCPIQDPSKALEIRQWLLENTTSSMVKRVLIYLSACLKWGIKRNLTKVSVDPFDGMAAELPQHNWEKNPEPNAFTQEEKEKIIFAFQDHIGNWNGRIYTGFAFSYYVPFVKFLFLTGCRPSEAIGLQWSNIKEDYSQITFDSSIVRVKGKAIRVEGSKNNKVRKFNCNQELQELLKVHKPVKYSPDDLVFPGPKGKPMNYGNFSRVVWKKVVDPIVGRASTPYSCRDTFISEQVAKGVPTAVVAKWVDNSVEIIEKRYLDSKLLEQLKPL